MRWTSVSRSDKVVTVPLLYHSDLRTVKDRAETRCRMSLASMADTMGGSR